MFLRRHKIERGDKTYEYVYLARTYRDENGRNKQETLANLSDLDEVQIQNFERLLEANRRGEAIAIDTDPSAGAVFDDQQVLANLDYLDVAVALKLFDDWSLGELLDSVIEGEPEVDFSDTVAALVIHRLVDPGSKSQAIRWFDTTALAELLGVKPSRFNNSRIHRTLNKLAKAQTRIQRGLCSRYQNSRQGFGALFVDVTDTWFEGRGCQQAEKGKTKEGLVRHKIGIALLCNHQGYPMRWQVVDGNQHDSLTIKQLLGQLDSIEWLHQIPVVMDRAMGQLAQLRWLKRRRFRFVTALISTQYEKATDRIPHDEFSDIDISPDDELDNRVRALIEQRAEQASLVNTGDQRWVLDLGVVDIDEPTVSRTDAFRGDDGQLPRTVRALERGRRFHREHQRGRLQREIGADANLSANRVCMYIKMYQRLTPAIRQRIFDGEGAGASITDLEKLSKLDDDQQKKAFEQLVVDRSANPVTQPGSTPGTRNPDPVCGVRLVVTFSVERFFEVRRQRSRQLQQLNELVERTNDSLHNPNGGVDEQQAVDRIRRRLRENGWLQCFEIVVDDHDDSGPTGVKLVRDDNRWERKGRFDGFNLLACHPDISMTADAIDRLYRAKDAVEKDFQVIKSVCNIRPVYHHTNPKVQAHVTLCMLALLVERTLKHRLEDTDYSGMSARRILNLLSNCHLNRIQPGQDAQVLHTITRCTPEQKAILKALNLQKLSQDTAMMGQIMPR